MEEKQIHDLAIAYAQVKLTHYQQEYEKSCEEEELYQFAKAYKFALENLEHQYNQID